MNYGEVLEKAWKTIWKHKILWLFGLLAGCGANGGGGGGGGGNASSSFQGRDFSNGPNFDVPRNAPPWLQDFAYQLERSFETGTFWAVFGGLVIGLICLAFFLGIVAILLRVVGRIGLVRGAWQADEGVEKLTLGGLLGEVKPFFWRVLLFEIILIGVGLLSALILIFPVVLVTMLTLGCGLLCLLPVLIVLGWAINTLTEIIIVSLVGDNLDIGAAISRGWDTFKSNLGPLALMSLILYIGQGIISLIIALPLFLVAVPILVAVMAQTEAAIVTGITLTLIFFLIYIPIAIFLGAVLQSYVGSAWTLTYRRLTGRQSGDVGEGSGKPEPEPLNLDPIEGFVPGEEPQGQEPQ